MDYYKAEKVNDKITAIRSLSGEIMYLIQGEKEAVLIDTCIGIKGLKRLVMSLIDQGKPLTVLISHGHIDHAMGAPEFDNCYMNGKDIPLYQSQCDIPGRRGYAGMGLGPDAEKLSDQEFVEPTLDYPFKELEEGIAFDLGGISVVAYDAAGHTPGCMAFLIPEERILITGDACNNSTFLFDDICLSLADYEKSMVSLKAKTQGKYDRVFLMHHVMDAPVDILDQMIELCGEIKAGQIDNIPFEFMGKKATQAKAANERMERNDGKFANLIFNPGRID